MLAHDEHEALGDLPVEGEELHLLPLERIILRDTQELAVAEKPLPGIHGQGIPFVAPDDLEDIRVFGFADLPGELGVLEIDIISPPDMFRTFTHPINPMGKGRGEDDADPARDHRSRHHHGKDEEKEPPVIVPELSDSPGENV